MKQPIFNGKTWVVAIIGMLSIMIITIASLFLVGYVATLIPANDKVLETIGGIGGVLFGAFKGIEMLFNRLTYVPKGGS